MMSTTDAKMEYVLETIASIGPADETFRKQAREKWKACAKPLGSLGVLEGMVTDLCTLEQTLTPDLGKRVAVIFCADNGVVAEGVTQTGPEVTRLVADQLSAGRSSVNRMASVAGVDVVPVDIGMLAPENEGDVPPQLLQRAVAPGTADLMHGPAMTNEQLFAAICEGIRLVEELKAQGAGLLIAGEMGIGNTTTSSAVAAVLLGKDPDSVTGKGAGLTDKALIRKMEVIREAIRVNRPDPASPLDVLRTLGGFDLAGMCGLYIGGAKFGVPVLADGFPSAVAALCAARTCPNASKAIFASHVSAEPAGQMVLAALGKTAPIAAGMRLGEGTGGVACVPLLDMALSVFEEAYTFEEGGIEPYEEL
ncbi:MAG: nicotinate-nucleotide--dimethylbenzimidazole phosphoribosyltransferase [Clostridia bacterium]|nr:nicotinate-nucleotide--dimethylbenzimidazole phosphoribosyltransferase [Clostridia bacterium]